MKYSVYGMGNALVDMEFKVSDDFLKSHSVEKGLMTLVEEDRQHELINLLKQNQSGEIKRQCGGSAANTMIAISQFGGKAYYSCKVANDETGQFYLNDLKESGVDTKLTKDSAGDGITGKCMVMVTPDAERTMNTFLGTTATYSSAETDEEALKNSEWLYIEGYLVASPTGQEAAVKARKFAKDNGVKVALTMSDPSMVEFFNDNMNALVGDDLDLLFCNEIEAMSFTKTDNVLDAREKLKNYAKNFVITLGKNGAVVWDGNMFIDIEPHVVDALDTNGAGDMYAGAYLYGITNGHTPAGSASLASYAASKIVSQYGPRLELAQAKQVKEEVLGDK